MTLVTASVSVPVDLVFGAGLTSTMVPWTVDPAGMPWFAKGDGDLFRGVPYEVRLSMPIVRDGKVEFSFPTVSSANYVVQVWRDLGLPWAQLQRVAGDGSTVTVTDTPPAGLGASFYGVFQE